MVVNVDGLIESLHAFDEFTKDEMRAHITLEERVEREVYRSRFEVQAA